MGLRVYDFRCPWGHVTEHFVDSDTEQVQCHCECMADRMISAPRAKLDGCSGDFPGEAMKWEKRREDHMKKERKNKENHGTWQ